MKLTIGSSILAEAISNQPRLLLSEDRGRTRRFAVTELSRPDLGRLSHYVNAIEEVTVGYIDLAHVDFLARFPNVMAVRILTPSMKDISGLRYLKRLERLVLERPTCRMDILGELKSLKVLYLDGWRPGATSVFQLRELVDVGIQSFGCPNLRGMSEWASLEDLWLNGGKLEDLSGIPPTVRRLRLTTQRKLSSLCPVHVCTELQDLQLDACRATYSLDGLESCRELKILSIACCGAIKDLEPLRPLKKLEYLFISEHTFIEDKRVEAIYTLPNLRTVIITKKSGVERDRLLASVPQCDVRLTTL